MRSYPKYQNDIQLTEGPTDPYEYEAKQLQQKMGLFKYCKSIGELIYALNICQVDISSSLITLSKYSAPAKICYDAVKQIFLNLYLYATKHYGLTYWRSKPRKDLQYVQYSKRMIS